ncbi:MAG TPA: hypothetical protein VFQ80_10835 [Thermomicrobiales bacterium]|nr:hypothetical protein [Thermomicrobiales bacterium]
MELVATKRIDRPRGPHRRRLVALAAALLAGATLSFGGAAAGLSHDPSHEAAEQAAASAAAHEGHDAAGSFHANSANVTMNGDTLEIVAPAGAFDRLAAGGHDLDLPPVLRMRVGQTIEIRNDDSLTHIVLGQVVPPGQAVRRTLTQPGIEVYAAGCAIHASGTGMTSLIVSPASERS